MRILVTGGAGFIGSNFIRYYLPRYPNDHLINLDLLTYAGNLENLKDVEQAQNYTFVKGNIADKYLVDQLFKEGIDVVFNFAAESHVDRSVLSPEEFVRTNVLGTQVLLDAAKKYGVQKFIQVSTDEVYGSLGNKGYFTETTPLAPNSPYSASKASSDLLVMAYHKTYGLPVNITRCSNNYGPYQFPEKLIPLMLICAVQNKPLPLYGDGTNVRDWLHVMDHCRALDMVLRQGIDGEIYNIGGNNEKTNLEIVQTILQELGKPTSLIRHVKDRLGHDYRYAIDSSKIQKELGWKPKYSFKEGIQETIDWYLNHREWWERITTGDYQRYYEEQYRYRFEEVETNG